MQTTSEAVGSAVGAFIAPFFALTSALRRARTFHPCGELVDAVVTPHPLVRERHRAFAERLSGRALVRFSDALTKGEARWPDVLGCALRFGADHAHLDGDQDILFATILRPWTLGLAPFTTRVSDFLGNDYFAVSPFSVEGLGRVYLRLRPSHRACAGRSADAPGSPPQRRVLRLTREVAAGAELVLGAAKTPYGPFHPIARLRLVHVWEDEPRELRFDPFRAGRGVHPRGFVHALRRAVYPASQRARAAADRRAAAKAHAP